MVYFISGLGADYRLFNNLDLTGIEHRFLNWLKPLKNEKFADYLERLIAGIDQSQEVILVGVSFGGMAAQEIARRIPVKKVVLISSVKSEKEFDLRLKLPALGRLDKPVPGFFMKWGAGLIANYFFSIKTEADAAFLKELIETSYPELIKWSVRQVLSWKSAGEIPNLVHIHGDNDRVFPIGKIQNPIIVKGGGHFMVADQAQEISLLLRKELINASGPRAVPGGQ